MFFFFFYFLQSEGVIPVCLSALQISHKRHNISELFSIKCIHKGKTLRSSVSIMSRVTANTKIAFFSTLLWMKQSGNY